MRWGHQKWWLTGIYLADTSQNAQCKSGKRRCLLEEVCEWERFGQLNSQKENLGKESSSRSDVECTTQFSRVACVDVPVKYSFVQDLHGDWHQIVDNSQKKAVLKKCLKLFHNTGQESIITEKDVDDLFNEDDEGTLLFCCLFVFVACLLLLLMLLFFY